MLLYLSLHQSAPQGTADKPGLVVRDRQPTSTGAAIEEFDGEAAQLDECETPAANRWLVLLRMDKAIDDYRRELVKSGHSDLEAALVRT